MRASTNILDNNLVKLIVEVDEEELAIAIDHTAKELSQTIVIKGFRKGKAPRQLIEARLGGAGALRAEAINDAMSDFYARAVSDTMIDPIGQPAIVVTSGESEGPLAFEAEVEVRPEVDITGQRELKVTIPSPLVGDDEIEDQITRLRETDSELKDIDRPIVTGDVLIVDVKGVDPSGETEDIDVSDFSYVVGSEAIAQGVDETIIGLRAGETLQATGRKSEGVFINFDIAIKQVRERILPDLTSEWLSENTEYDTEEAMREGIMSQLGRRKLVEAQFARRDATLVALSQLVEPEIAPEVLVTREIEQRLSDLSQRLDKQGLGFDYFLQLTNQTPEQLVDVIREDALRAVRIDLALRSLVRAEGLEPSDEEIETELSDTATAMSVDENQLRANLRDNGRMSAFVAEVAKMKASKWLLDNVTYVDANGAEIDRSLLETDQSGEADA
jgi:trigger factor